MAKQTVTWDSCIVMDAIQREPARYPTIEPMIRAAEAGELRVVMSTASLAEVFYLGWLSREQGMSQADQNNLIAKWLSQEWIIKRNADVGVCIGAAELRRQHNTTEKQFTSIDAIILSTALTSKSDALITYDEGRSDNTQLGLLTLHERVGNPPLRIVPPEEWSMQPELDLS